MRHIASYGVLLASVGGCVICAACGAFTAADDETHPAAPAAGADGAADGPLPDGAKIGDAAPPSDDAGLADARDGGFAFGPPCNGAPSCDRIVFVTHGAMAGAFGNVLAADAICQGEANKSTLAAVRARTFKAWLSATGSSPSTSFMHGTGRYLRTDGLPVVSDWTTLTAGKTLLNPIAADENGDLVAGAVWTGTSFNGTLVTGGASSVTCSDWMSLADVQRGVAGSSSDVTTSWTLLPTPVTCNTLAHFYCFEQ